MTILKSVHRCMIEPVENHAGPKAMDIRFELGQNRRVVRVRIAEERLSIKCEQPLRSHGISVAVPRTFESIQFTTFHLPSVDFTATGTLSKISGVLGVPSSRS